jgi:hypothetical protein
MILITGCSDDRAVAISREAADRQAAQNLEMSRHNREVAAAHHELASAQQEMQSERQHLSSGWNELESERRQIARDRRTRSLLAALVPMVGTVAVIVAALYFAGRLVHEARSAEAVDTQLCELLVTDLAAQEPLLVQSHGNSPAASLLTHIPQEDRSLESHSDNSNASP